MSNDDWMDDAIEAVEQAIDAQDAQAHRDWRYRAVGDTTANVVALAARTKSASTTLNLHPPAAEMMVLREVAASCGLTPVQLVRQCVATHLTEDVGIEAGRIPWFMRDGLLP